MPHISEGLVTTINADGSLNLSPMGPVVKGQYESFRLRPFQTSTTYANLTTNREGVFHVTDDACLIAKAALKLNLAPPPTVPASQVSGLVLADCCRWFEFQVAKIDASRERVEIECEIVHRGVRRDFFGFNRANHAILEAAIVSTRLHLIPQSEIDAEFERLEKLIHKTGLSSHLSTFAELRSLVESHFNETAERNQ